jgi:signal transduction histidine kinase/pSer/pThr/pTyr-binding forkhead associated (FHA) protein
MPRIAVLAGVDKGLVFRGLQASVTLGTAADNDLILADPYASRHHGEATLSGGRWTYRDLKSTNGSAVERAGTRITLDPSNPEATLQPGDLILVGRSVLQFEAEPAAQEGTESTFIATRTREQVAARQSRPDSLEEIVAACQLERDIGLAFEPEALLDATLEAMLRAFPAATHALVLLVDRKTGRPKRQVARARGEAGRLKEGLPVSLSVAARVLEEGHAVLFRDVPAEFRDSQSVAVAGIGSSLCAPLWTGEETVGLVQVESRGGLADFAERDLDRLAVFANRAALAIVACELCESERTNQLLQDLSEMISHDLKDPLTSIKGFLGVLSEDPLADAQKRSVSIALSSSRWLEVLIAGILDVAKMEAGQAIFHREPLSVAEEVEQALLLLSYEVEARSLRVEIAIPPDLPPVFGDRNCYRRILTNLLGNAVKLAPPGSRVGVSATLTADGDGVVVAVQDEGPGIAKEHQARIFDKFYQAAERARSRRKMSVGLGLTFCRLAVEAQGGRIWVESEPGQGACFSFSLPVIGDGCPQ